MDVDAASVNINPQRENARKNTGRGVVDTGRINARVKDPAEKEERSAQKEDADMLSVSHVSRQSVELFRLL